MRLRGRWRPSDGRQKAIETAAWVAQSVVTIALAKQAVVVTGGSSGLGAAVVDALLAEGAVPHVLDLSPPKQDVPHGLVDLSQPGAATEAVRALVGDQDIRGVVTAAGTDACGRLDDVPEITWDRVIAVNLLGTAAVVRATLPHLVPGGDVVTIASTLGLRALSDATAYCASKFGVVGFTRALALELSGQFRVTLVVPGGMATSFFDDRTEQYRPGPDAALADPRHVAALIVSAMALPREIEVKELIVGPPGETSWP
jgi:NAD(P)-dependent dehydrogenase (short-subunit alcohol dehydrogenase family)